MTTPPNPGDHPVADRSVYVHLPHTPGSLVRHTKDLGGVLVDYDGDGEILGVEVLGAQKIVVDGKEVWQ